MRFTGGELSDDRGLAGRRHAGEQHALHSPSATATQGAPRVIHVPGCTAGSAALHFADRDAICVGDAFVTRNVITGATGPQLFPNFNSDNEQAFATLARFERVEARFVLAGHGDPWDRGLTEAVRVARDHWTSRR